jgi:hypothetical protein
MQIEDQRQDIIKLLNEIVEGSSLIRTENLDLIQLRQIMDIGSNGEKILAILNDAPGPDKESLPQEDEENAKSTKTNVLELTEKLNELKEACAAFKANKVNEVIRAVKHISVDKSIDASVKVIAQLIDSLDYDKATVRIGMLLSILETYRNR